MYKKKLLADERLFAKDERNMDYKDFTSFKRDSSLSFRILLSILYSSLAFFLSF